MGKGGDKVGTDGEEWSEVSLTVIMNRGRQCIEGADAAGTLYFAL